VGQRPDLDLSGILANFNRNWLFPDQEEKVREIPEKDGLKFPLPQRFGVGPDVWSSCTELAVPVRFCWDVNGYYAALGVPTGATRRELREAYQVLEGQSSPYLTYVFKQLLNPETRAAYDAAPLGQLFLDEYTQRQLKRRAKTEAHRRSAQGEFVTAEQVMDDWGYVAEEEGEGVDTVSPTEQNSPRKAERLEYSYYGWKTTKFMMDEGVLQGWQRVLTATAAQLGIAPRLSFGITSVSDRPYILEQVGDRVVIFFLEGEEPTESVARDAIDALSQFPSRSRDGVSYDQSR
jgi:hypothetical protein